MRAARLLVVVATVLLQACGFVASPTVPTSPSSDASVGPSAIATEMSTSSPSPVASPTAMDGDLSGQVVAVVTQDLVMRSRPGTGADSEIYPIRLSAPFTVYVVAGPEMADGYEWYLVDIVEICTLDCWGPGWVAAADRDGERWLAKEPESPACPDPPTLDELLSLAPQLRLYCYGGRELILEGRIDASSAGPPHWPWQYRNALYASDAASPAPGCQDGCGVRSILLAHDIGVGVPLVPSATRLTGHFDDGEASVCAQGTEVDERIATHRCRMVFFVTSW